MMMKPNSWFVKAIKKYRAAFAVMTVVFYAVAIVLIIVVFPDVSNLWVSIFVLISGFTAAIMSLGELLVSAEESDKTDTPN